MSAGAHSAPGWSAERLGDPDGELLVVFIHGGFWRQRFTADTIAPLAGACAQLGQLVWNLEYPRVGMPGGGWPGTGVAVTAAVGAAVTEAAGRPVILVGHSAGGQLALLAAASQPVSLVVSLAGVSDPESGARQRIGEDAVVEFLGVGPDEFPELYVTASPRRQLPLGVASVLIHGDADNRVPIAQSRDYAALARAAGDRCELHELPGGDHFELIDPGGRAWPIVVAQLRDQARGVAP